MKLEFCHADTCLPCYWSGHHRPHVQIPVHRGMALKEIKDTMRHELRMGYVMGSSDDARLLSCDIIRPEEEKRADQLTRAAYAAVNRIKPANKGQRKFFLDLEEVDDDYEGESVYAYFVLMEI